jgi:hypothetical protein
MTLVGVVAYYASAPSAQSDFARPVTEQVRQHLRPVIGPTLAVMLAWRAAKRARTRWQGAAAGRGRPTPMRAASR